MKESDILYSFAFKGILTEIALDKTQRVKKTKYKDEELKRLHDCLGIDDLDEELVIKAQKWQWFIQRYALLKIQ